MLSWGVASSASAVISQLSPENLSVIQEHLGGAPEGWTQSEIGDGNLNLVFLLSGPDGRVVLKQALPYLRCVGESWPLSIRRNFFEFTALTEHAAVAPEYLPRVLAFNEASAALVLEFLGDHSVLRRGLMQGIRYPRFSEQIADYLARTLFFTSDLFLAAGAKKAKLTVFGENADLCKLTEDLIFTDPYREAEGNRWTSPELDSLARAFFGDGELKVAITQLKARFLTASEALIHGDLHTGSIMVNQLETKVIDPEFAFYGPMGFDVGLLLANFFLAYFSQAGLGGSAEYEAWLLQQASEIWRLFEQKFSALWDQQLLGDYLPARLLDHDTRAYVINRVRADYIARLSSDSLRFAGAEMIRRVLGLAHVAELDAIDDPEKRALAEGRVLRAGRKLLVHHERYADVQAATAMIRDERLLVLR